MAGPNDQVRATEKKAAAELQSRGNKADTTSRRTNMQPRADKGSNGIPADKPGRRG